MRVVASLLALAASALALQVTEPTNSTGWATSGQNTVTWDAVSTDPSNFTVVLVNMVCSAFCFTGVQRTELWSHRPNSLPTARSSTPLLSPPSAKLVSAPHLPDGQLVLASRSTWSRTRKISTPSLLSPTSLLSTLLAALSALLPPPLLVARAAVVPSLYPRLPPRKSFLQGLFDMIAH